MAGRLQPEVTADELLRIEGTRITDPLRGRGLRPMGTALSCAEGSTCPPVGTTRESGFRCASPVFERPLARPAVGSSASVAGLRSPWPCLVYDVFWLLSSGF